MAVEHPHARRLPRPGHRDRGHLGGDRPRSGARDVVLNVRQDNGPAVAVYRRLGYHVHAPYFEGPAVRRAGWERITRTLFGANDGSTT